ncbi:unnamed protein product, partial [Mesorhabditis spiculigera]
MSLQARHDVRRASKSDPLPPEMISFLRESMRNSVKQDPPYVFVVFGASGDLAKKKIYPTLWWLYRDELLPKNVHFVGYARSDLSVDKIREHFEKNAKVRDNEKEKFEQFLKQNTYIRGKYDTDEGFKKIQEFNDDLQKKSGLPVNRLYYLALPPSVFEEVTKHLKTNCMDKGDSWTRVIIEKPFGTDLDSSMQLSKHISSLFKEDQVYRIDHYLGKEMVQNLITLRFGNRLFGPSWNREHIASVVITFKEDFGTQGRAGYFDTSGIIRDVMQNHLMQVLTLLAMEKPVSLNAEDIRDEKVKVLKSMPELGLDDVIVGQYIANPDSNHPEAKKGYLEEEDVPKDSITPTYCMAHLRVNNERWDGVPFIMRCGKGLNEKKSEVRIQFREVPGDIYSPGELKRTELVIRVAPNEAVYLKLMTKKPGMDFGVEETELDLSYNSRNPSARSLRAAIPGSVHGTRGGVFTPVLKQLEEKRVKPVQYKFGSRGPAEADEWSKKLGYVYSGTYKWKNPNKL